MMRENRADSLTKQTAAIPSAEGTDASVQSEVPDDPFVYESIYVLMWRRFLKSHAGVAAAVVLILIYLLVLFAPFAAPYPIDEQHIDYTNAPPQRIRVFHDGQFVGPFTYPLVQRINPETYRVSYDLDRSSPQTVRFFARGHSYRLFGIFPASRHLVLPAESGTAFLLGTDRLGRDFLSRILAGMRVSLTIPILGMIISVTIGSIVGTISGYYGGAVDMIIQRIVEFLVSFPRIPLWLALSAALPANWPSMRVFLGLVLILSVIGWASLARQVRAKVLSNRHHEYVLAARAAGAKDRTIIFSHLLPSCFSHIIVRATLSIPTFILAESALSFLGLGIRPPMTSLGVLLKEAQSVSAIIYHPWLLVPGLVIILAILSFNFVGDALRDAADPLQGA